MEGMTEKASKESVSHRTMTRQRKFFRHWLGVLTLMSAFITSSALAGPLHTAAKKGDLERVERLIIQGTDLNAKDFAGHTPLYWAVSKGHRDIVELLIAKGANVNTRFRNGDTPLHRAAKEGHIEVAELLIAKGADVSSKNKAGATPLQLADRAGNTAIAKLLINAGARTEGKGEIPRPLKQEELQAAVMAFADSFSTKIVNAARVLENIAPSPRDRLNATRMKVYATASAIEIASGPHPGVALLDLLVLTTLNRMVWENYWRPEVYGEAADTMVEVLHKLEENIWSITAKVLTEAQQRELRDLIQEWHERNPETKMVNFIRFGDFGKLGRKPTLEQAVKPGGLLAPVREAVEAAEQIRATAERALYLATRMQLIAAMQAELVLQTVVAKPEVQQLLSDTAAFRKTSEQYREILDQLPQVIQREREATIKQTFENLSAERKMTIDQVMRLFAEERKRTIEDFVAEEKRLRGLLTEIRQALVEGTGLVTNLNTTVESVSSLAAQFTTEPSAADSKPFDIQEYREALGEASATVQQLNTLVESIDRLLTSPGLEKPLPQLVETFNQVEAKGEKLVNHAYRRAVVLILIFLVGAFLAMLAYRFLSERFIRS